MSTTAAEADELDVRVSFGDLPNQTIPVSWAETMLRLLRGRQPSLFVELMGEAATGYRVAVKSQRGQNGAG